MKPEKPIVYVVSKHPKSLKVIEASIGDHPMIVAASSGGIQEASRQRGIREDLYYRLAVMYPNATVDDEQLPDKYRGTAVSAAAEFTIGQGALINGIRQHILTEEGIDLKGYLKSTEAALIRQALDYSGGTMSQAAALLHLGRTTLTEKVKRLGLSDHIKTVGEAH